MPDFVSMNMLPVKILLAIGLITGSAAVAGAETSSESTEIGGILVRNDQWPRAWPFAGFARDVGRFIGDATGEEAALETVHWLSRVILNESRPPQTYDFATGQWTTPVDLLEYLNVYGTHHCFGHASLFVELWRQMGHSGDLLHLTGDPHAIAGLTYRDGDGIVRTHAVDSYGGLILYTPDGSRIATPEEIAATTDLRSLPGRSIFKDIYTNDKFLRLNERRYSGEIVAGSVRPYSHDPRWTLGAGESVEFWWYNKGRFYGDREHHEADYRGPMERACFTVAGGRTSYPEVEPYAAPYLFPRPMSTPRFPAGTLVRQYGNGVFRYRLAEATDARAAMMSDSSVGSSSRPRIPLSLNGGPAAVRYTRHFPYVITDATVTIQVVADAASGNWQLALTAHPTVAPVTVAEGKLAELDEGITFRPLEYLDRWAKNNPYGKYDLGVSLLFTDCPPNSTAVIEKLDVEVLFQHNMHILPRLLPGTNTITVEGNVPDGLGLGVAYEWETSQGDFTESRTFHQLPAEFRIDVPPQPIEQVRCRSLRLWAAAPDGADPRE